MNTAPVDSIKKRYIVSLLINILLFIPRLLNASLVPRSLGPAGYGDFQFLINNFLSIKNFLDFGTSTAFFTYSAKNDESSNLNIQYLLWWLFQFALIIIFVVSAYLIGVHLYIWPSQNIENIALAAVSAWLFLFAQQLLQFGDSKGLTVLCQKTNLAANLAAALLLLYFYFLDLLTIKTVLLIYVTGPIIIIIYLTTKLYASYFRYNGNILKDFNDNFLYFKKFCTPLFTYTIFCFIFDFIDRWLLQKYGGSEAQGYYSLSYNWAAIALLFFNPLLNIFWREVALYSKDNENEKIGLAFIKFSKFSFTIVSFIVVFLVFNHEKLIYLIAGKNFSGASFSFLIMLFYPLTQIYGQLIGCVYFATDRIKTYRNIGIAFMFINTSLTAIILYTGNFLNTSFVFKAEYYSLKFFLTSLIGADIMVYYICSKIRVGYFELVKHRLAVIVLFLLSGYVNNINKLWTDNIFLLTISDVLLYTGLCALAIMKFRLLKEFFGEDSVGFRTLMNVFKRL